MFFPYPDPDTASLAPNVYKGECQGLDSDFETFVPVLLRSAAADYSLSTRTPSDDWQRILLIRRSGDRTPGGPKVISPPTGALLRYAGSTWLVRQSKTMHAVPGGAVVSRCNALALLTDAQGEEKQILLCLDSEASSASPRLEQYGLYPAHSLSAVCQYNSVTALITEGTRLMINGTSWTCRGVNNLLRSVTLDSDSTHIMYFAIERSTGK